ncbi:carboxypeptidase regulatory-like domain-containing protein [Edaphobacter bradus]|uniref:carboxypeptidase regulatory-like domain-containing protein n=1 Tax=Edaphobacter bradus TaxID=2259016 RepID=UPI0021E0D63D|nr:carboxypeptidase regulatory-like domain-containing protein [Edaphobacter bradus]
MHRLIKKHLSLLLPVLLLAVVAACAQAQSNYGAVRGTVTDVQGAALTPATVSLISQSKMAVRSTVSNSAGEFVFNAVEPDTYTLRVSMDGFKTSENKGIAVDSGNTIPFDVKLQIGSTSQSVEVTATEDLVTNGTSYNGQLIDSQKLENLPNPGRNPFLFSKLDNAVTAAGDPRFVRFQDQSGSSTISIAGGPMSSNNYSVDGVPITDFSNRAVIIPSIEAVEEVKVQANTYDAEIGRTSGGMFNTTLKSGSNALHGVLQGETRQTNWGANTFFNNQKGIPRGAAEFYSYVGSLSGPIPLPTWLGGKDKTFFAITGEGYRQRSPFVNTTSFVVPTALQRGGDFSEIGTVTPTGTCATGTNGKDAICIKNLAAGGYYPGNKITNINPIGLKILQAYPTPNTTESRFGVTNFNGGDTLGDRADEFNGKVTHQFSSRWLADFYYLHYGSKEPGGNPLQTQAGYSGSYLLYRKVDAIGIQNTISVNPTTVLTVGFGFNRFPNNTLDISNGFDQTTLGLPSYYTSAQSKKAFPRITADASLANEGTSNSGPQVYFSRNFVVGIGKNLGRHSLKAGYNYRAISLTFTSLSDASGWFNFNNLSGTAAADILQGFPTTGQLIVPSQLAYTTGYQAVYLQDDFRLNPRLTFNLGFRYEYEPGIHERDNRISVGFDRNAVYNAFGSSVQAKGGVEFAGQNGYGTNTGNMGSKYNPRAGFAYAVDNQTVVKVGYGVFYAPEYYTNNNGYAPGYILTNSIPSQSGTPTISLSNPYPTIKTTPTGNSNGLSTSIGTTLSLIDQYRRSPLFQSYSLQVEHEFPMGVALKIGYVGGHGRNLPNSLNINQLPDSQYSQGTTLSTKVANPYVGLGSWGPGKVNKYQTLLPFPQYQAITMATSLGKSNYNSLDLKVQKRFNRGVTLLAAYTWASNWDNIWGAYGSSNSLNSGNNGPQDIYDLSREYARATNDIPNRLSLAGTLELPFGRGKPFLSGVNRWVDLAVGGWRFNDITVIQNGGPLAITQGNANSSYGNSTQRPSLIAGSSPCKSGSPEGRLNSYFNAAAYSITAPFAYGTAPRASNCYGPGYINSDLSLNKDFRVTERVHAEFRAEALNAFNTPQFATPSLSVGSSSVNTKTGIVTTTPNSGAGQITGTLGFPRLVQLGGRLTF